MELTYTTVRNIQIRLRGRLNIVTEDATSPYALTIGSTTVEPDLIELVGSQVEGYVNMILDQIYILPLQNRHPVIADIVESLIESRLMTHGFQGGPIPGESTDVATSAMNSQAHAHGLLQQLTVGHGIYIPVPMPTQQTMPGMTQGQPLRLPGERLKANVPDTVTRNVTLVGKWKDSNPASQIVWGGIPTDPSRARNAERIWR